jgi:hypothetical protein
MAIDPIVARLCGPCPSFRLSDAEEMSELGRYAVLGEFAHHLVELTRQGRPDEVVAVLAVVEQVLGQGTDDEITIVRNGLLETLQNIVSHRDVPLSGEAFLPLLGPRGAAEWHDLNETWLLAAATRPDGGAVTVEDYLRVQDPDIRRHLQASRRELTDGRMIGLSDVFAYEETRVEGVRRATARMRQVTLGIVLVCAALLILGVLLG